MSENVTQKILEMAQLQLLGLNNKEIADKLEICERTVYRWKTSPIFIEEYEALKAGLHEKLRVRVLQAVMQGVDDMEEYRGACRRDNARQAMEFFKIIKLHQLIAEPQRTGVGVQEVDCNNP